MGWCAVVRDDHNNLWNNNKRLFYYESPRKLGEEYSFILLSLGPNTYRQGKDTNLQLQEFQTMPRK